CGVHAAARPRARSGRQRDRRRGEGKVAARARGAQRAAPDRAGARGLPGAAVRRDQPDPRHPGGDREVAHVQHGARAEGAVAGVGRRRRRGGGRRSVMSDLDLDSLDWLLGRLDGVESARVAAANAADPVLGQRTADTAQFLARLRELQPPPATPGFFVRLRYSVRRRTELRVVRAPVRVQSVLRDVVRVAAVAAVVLGAALLGEAACRRLVVRPPVDVDALPLPDPLVAIDGSPRPDPTEPFVDVEPPPTRVQVVSPFFAQVEEVTADDGAEAVLSWLGARNELDALRNEF